ncbi:MAG TPA: hypothetical protein VFY94_11345 [Rhodanobacteraceae bacterium]|jgi:hypothetical protein|nr:hypothetical protein [Rhodanobacteraceae bacterium]
MHNPSAEAPIDTKQADRTVCAADIILVRLGWQSGQYGLAPKTRAEYFNDFHLTQMNAKAIYLFECAVNAAPRNVVLANDYVQPMAGSLARSATTGRPPRPDESDTRLASPVQPCICAARILLVCC